MDDKVWTLGAKDRRYSTPGIGARVNGMGYLKCSYFIVATMAGAGFLALPRAFAKTGWLGPPMMTVFVCAIGFSATRLGKAWVLLEERWPTRYRYPAQQPYMAMAEESFGVIFRKFCLCTIIFTLIGYGISFTIAMAGMLNKLQPSISTCEFSVIVTGIVWLPTFFGTPADFWQASLIAVVATGGSILVIIINVAMDTSMFPDPQHPNPDFESFALGFATILFTLGGASIFPTLQNDMQNRNDWWKSVVIGFVCIWFMYIPVGTLGYTVIGDDVSSNVILDVPSNWSVYAAVIMGVVNLLITYVVDINPVCQALEDVFSIPPRFGPKRIILRSVIVMLMLTISLLVPDFEIILNVIGGSTITLLSFFFPPLMYMKLMDMKAPPGAPWKTKTMPLWERIFLWFIVIIAAVGGVSSTIFALKALLSPSAIGDSCMVNFHSDGSKY